MKRLFYSIVAVILFVCCTKPVSEGPDQPTAVEDTTTSFDVRLFAPGDYGSTNWRIPAILCLDDGSLLIACDKRKFNESDLPEDIDIVTCRSTDGGRTWGEIEDLTAQLWGSQATNTACRNYRGAFFSSGNGLRVRRGEHAGRILFAIPMLRKNENVSDNFIVYSDDNGHSWQVSGPAYLGGDEAKLMELVDGRILLSTRQSGARGFNHSSDGGITWGTQGRWTEMTTNACNGDMLRVMATDRGDSINLLLHSIPNSMQRRDVSLFLSYDEGDSWQDPILLFDGPSVYSSLTLLPNGGVGIFLEQNPNGACEMWYKYLAPRDLPW